MYGFARVWVLISARIVVMDKGLLLENGTHDELTQDPHGVYTALWNAQLQQATDMTPASSATELSILDKAS